MDIELDHVLVEENIIIEKASSAWRLFNVVKVRSGKDMDEVVTLDT